MATHLFKAFSWNLVCSAQTIEATNTRQSLLSVIIWSFVDCSSQHSRRKAHCTIQNRLLHPKKFQMLDFQDWKNTLCLDIIFILTFIGLCIVIYSYSTTNKMHLFLKLFILVKSPTCFERSFRPSPGAQNCTYGNRHMSNNCCYLLLVGMKWNSIPFRPR